MKNKLQNYIDDVDFKSWYKIVKPIINSKEFQKRKFMKHHDDSVFEHSVSVSFCSYKLALKRKKSLEFCISCAVAGLLHDFYPRAWQYSSSLKYLDDSYSARFNDKENNRDLHGFTHPRDALENSKKFYKEFLNKEVEDAILRHMFPLTIIPPKHLVGWYITLADKIVSFTNLPKFKEFPKYIGIKVYKNK